MSLDSSENAAEQLLSADHKFNVRIKISKGQNPGTIIDAIRRLVGDIEMRIESSEVVAATVSGNRLESLDDAIFKYDLECVESHPHSLVVPK